MKKTDPTKLSPKEFENLVVRWLKAASRKLDKFEVKHLQQLPGSGGDYEFDAVAQFTILSGAQIIILVECKRYSYPIERELVQTLWAKLQDVKAHKGMMFATSDFRSGALQYAKTYNIATIKVIEGKLIYQTKGGEGGPLEEVPSMLGMPDYAGKLMSQEGNVTSTRIFDEDHTEVLSEWLQIG